MSILEISEKGCHIASYRGFITLSVGSDEIQRIPIDQITSIITKAHGITYTQNILVKLAEYKIPLVITNKGFKPVSILLPIDAHNKQTQIIQAQANAYTKKTLNNKLWQKIIINKIQMQAAVLAAHGKPFENIANLANQVNAGDTKNTEAQAARFYFTQLFGDSFRRNRTEDTPNDMLNYGYTICRSAIARYVCSAGLMPALGIFHRNQNNAFCLVDDLLEPYRALVDYKVYQLLMAGEHELNSQVKQELVGILNKDIRVGTKWESVEESMKILASSLNKCYINQTITLKLPKINLDKFNKL